MKLFITTAFGLESVVSRELEKLGYENMTTENGRIILDGGYEDICRLNVNVSAGERVLIRVGEFVATSFDELFENTKHLPSSCFPSLASTSCQFLPALEV